MLSGLLASCEMVLVGALNQIQLTQIAVADNKLYLMGDFNAQSDEQIIASLNANPQVDTLVLTVSSGSLDDETTFKIAREVRQRQLNTHLLYNSVIASGAVDFFLAGVNRSMEIGAKIGVHSWSDGVQEAKDMPKQHADHALNANYIEHMLGTDDFYWFTIYAAPADAIYWMSETEINQYQLLTQTPLDTRTSDTPFGTLLLENRKELLEGM